MPSAQANKASSAERAVLARFGMTEAWQVALLLPIRYDDITAPSSDARQLSDTVPLPLSFTVAGMPMTSGSGGVPRVRVRIADDSGNTYSATIFGNARAWAERLLMGARYTFLATAKVFAGELYVTLRDLVEPVYVGKLRPTYPVLKSKQTPTLVRSIVHGHLPKAIEAAASFVERELGEGADVRTILQACGAGQWGVRELIEQVHAPRDADSAERAHAAYQRLAAVAALRRLQMPGPQKPAKPIIFTTLDKRIGQMRFTMTQDQRAAIDAVAALLAQPYAARALIAGEVGSGKTAVASLAAAAVVDASADNRVLVMVPNETLAAQFRAEFDAAFGDIESALVTAQNQHSSATARIIFGTSAVLFRNLGRFALVIVDEQQSWSRAQREHYVRAGTHLIELSATPIPRTQALLRFGHVQLLPMRQSPVPKNIRTRLWEGPQALRRLNEGIRGVVERGSPVLVVYPKREVGKSAAPGAVDDRYSIEAAVPRWEKLFPGRVRAITSDDDQAAKAAAIRDLEEGRASVLLATTVVQVGLNIRGLRHIVIAHPDRHGITALHQLRGRVARHGGDGFCELLVLEPLSDKARERLEAVRDINDGFALAEKDLDLRGTGDLGEASDTQSGSDRTFLYGLPLTVDLLRQAEQVLQSAESWAQADEKPHNLPG